MILAPLSLLLGIASASYRGSRQQFEVALLEGREPTVSGPYRRLRYPMYTSLIGMATATAAGYSWWPLALVGLPILLMGVELGVNAEDRMFADRFQDMFIEYSSRVSAYLPFFR
ncbi:MAG TPA: hypothetical protein VMV57_16190 [Terracidiphilus sp.]|nr:hypothetical protein [Terracidiphilus sp.]